MRILVICGTRPEAVKMAPVCQVLQANPDIEYQLCVTAQHREMLDQVLSLFMLKANYDLDLMTPGQDLTDLTCAILSGLKPVLRYYKPDRILVHGDTTTTLAASLAAYYQQIPVAHIEAGLRTDNIYSPWPEEGNRQLATRLADRHYAPTLIAQENLQKEGVVANQILVTGNTVIDALLQIIARLNDGGMLVDEMKKKFPFLCTDKKMILVTGHRRESFGRGFEDICRALKELSEREDIQIVYPVHLNPAVQEPVYRLLGKIDSVKLISPQDYLPFVYLMHKSHFIITDSGGIQEEAPSIGKPVLLMREHTERPEAVEAGTAILVGTDKTKIITEAVKLLNNQAHYNECCKNHSPYGNGTASNLIMEDLLNVG